MESKELRKKIIQNPLALFAVVFGKPFEYQKQILVCTSKRITFRSGRQVGKTTLAAVRAIHHALNQNKAVVIIISKTLRQSGIMFRRIRSLFKHPLIFEEIENESQTMIVLKNGSEIHCLPGNNPDSIRGFSITRAIVDEAAFVKDDLFIALEPSLAATNGDLEFYSSPFGKRGRFYNAFFDDNFTTFHVKSKESPLITPEFLEGMRKSMTDIQYIQEYEGEFVEEQDSFFPRNLILKCTEDIPEQLSPMSDRDYFLGVDVARYGLDETVYTVAEVDYHGKVRITLIKSTSKKPLTDVIERVEHLHKVFRFRNIYMDASGLGAGAVDVLKQRNLPLRNLKVEIDGVEFTLQNKEEMYNNLKFLMEQGKIEFPKHDKLLLQLAELQYEFTEGGHIKIHHPDNGRDDFPDSLALACIGIRKKHRPINIVGGGQHFK